MIQEQIKNVIIFWPLCHCNECVINISAVLNMSNSAVSRHLKSLKNSGLIVCHRKGKKVYYQVADAFFVNFPSDD